MIRLRMMILVGHVECTGEKRNTCVYVLAIKPGEKKTKYLAMDESITLKLILTK
jgi:ribosome-binding factor A